jgi:hypothetical protein
MLTVGPLLSCASLFYHMIGPPLGAYRYQVVKTSKKAAAPGPPRRLLPKKSPGMIVRLLRVSEAKWSKTEISQPASNQDMIQDSIQDSIHEEEKEDESITLGAALRRLERLP